MDIYKIIIAFSFLFLTFSCGDNTDSKTLTAEPVKKNIEENEDWDNLAEDSSAQIYACFTEKEFIDKKQIKKIEYGQEEITYLGPTLDQNGNIVSHVISLFYTVQAAIQVHGHSNIIFIHKDKKLVKRFDLGVPDELPYKLEDNVLFFHYTDNSEKVQTFVDTIGTTLPKIICVGPDNCY